MPTSEVLQKLQEYRKALIFREEMQLRRMAEAWHAMERDLAGQMKLLAYEIMQRKGQGDVITEQLIAKMERWKELQSQLKEQSFKYATGQAVVDIRNEQWEFAKLGLASAQDAIRLSNPLSVRFNAVPIEALKDYIGMLGDGTPLQRLLKEAYPDSVQGITQALLNGVSQGLNPERIAYNMSQGMDLGLERLTLIARTEQLRMWRVSTQAQYQASGVVPQVRRLASKTACMACLMSDGELLPVTEVLTDHPRGRCTTIPVVKGAPPVQWETGRQWFENQPEDVQRKMMGDNYYDAWKAGKFDLSQLRSDKHSDVWGDHPYTTSLADLLDSGFISAPPEFVVDERFNLEPFLLDRNEMDYLEYDKFIDAFHNGLDADDFDTEIYSQLVATYKEATGQMQSALSSYQGSGADRMNRLLRLLETQGKAFDPKYPGISTEEINQLIKMFERVTPLEKDITVVRGVGEHVKERLLDKMTEGTIFHDAGFLSTSINLGTARSFAGTEGMIFEIHVPAGVKALLPRNRYEYEVIFDRASQMEVVGVRWVTTHRGIRIPIIVCRMLLP